ncbi:hypothetical protein AB0K80_23160 [Streptomyces sp. NPDC052682]|uniref:hypothetical protein n=1 Tax=Streptomyces sp. NPDC052682 TaxID=3154954 RepID=UPI0034209AD6
MFRGTTARTMVPLLAGVLLALQFFAPTASFASAHTVRHVEAKALPGTKPSGKAPRAEHVTCRTAHHHGDPTGPLRTRDRLHTAGQTTAASGRPSHNPGPAVPEPVPPGAAHPSTSRWPATHTPAALQVFRC